MSKNHHNCTAIMVILGISLASSSISFSQSAAQDASQTASANITDIHHDSPVRSGSSETSRFHFNIGVKKYKEKNWDEAEKAFEAVLRANDLHKQANFYLAHINSKQGENENVIKYVKAYHGFQESYVSQNCLDLIAMSDTGLVSLIEGVNSGVVPQSELTSRIIELTEALGPELVQACKLVSKRQAGHVDFLTEGNP